MHFLPICFKALYAGMKIEEQLLWKVPGDLKCTHNSAPRHEVNQLTRMVYVTDIDDYYHDPGRYTGWYENFLS